MKDQSSRSGLKAAASGTGGLFTPMQAREVAERTLHQTLITAVKHSAIEVFVEMRGESCSALFRFNDRAPIKVELECSPEQFTGAVLNHSIITGSERTATLGVGRVRTKSCTVDFQIRSRTGQEHLLRSSTGLAAASVRRSIALSEFCVDAPGNPLFTLSLGDDSADFHSAMSASNGLFAVASHRHAPRNFAITAIRELYPHAEVVPLFEGNFTGSQVAERSESRVVIVGVDDASDLTFLSRITRESPETRSLFLGVLAFRMVPRNCPFCVVDAVPSTQLAQHHQQLTGRLPGRSLKGKGCDVCGQLGVVGKANVVSLINLAETPEDRLEVERNESNVSEQSERGLGTLLRAGATLEELFDRLLVENGGRYRSISERGASAVAAASISLDRFAEHFELPPLAFAEALMRANRVAPILTSGGAGGSSNAGARAIVIEGDFFFVPSSSDSKVSSEDSSDPKQDAPTQSETHEGIALAAEENVACASDAEGLSGRIENAVAEVVSIESARPPDLRESGRVLVVHPDPEQRGQIGSEFELRGYSVDFAASSVEGMILALKHSPAAIIIGVEQSDAHDDGLLKQLRQHHRTKEIPILALLKTIDFKKETELLTSGVSDVTSVEIPRDLLCQRLKRLIEIPRTRSQ